MRGYTYNSSRAESPGQVQGHEASDYTEVDQSASPINHDQSCWLWQDPCLQSRRLGSARHSFLAETERRVRASQPLLSCVSHLVGLATRAEIRTQGIFSLYGCSCCSKVCFYRNRFCGLSGTSAMPTKWHISLLLHVQQLLLAFIVWI